MEVRVFMRDLADRALVCWIAVLVLQKCGLWEYSLGSGIH